MNFRGVREKSGKWYATIRKDNVMHELGHWNTPEEVARAYDARAVELFQHNARVNFPEDREHAQFLVPEGMRVCTKAKEKENREAENQLFDPMVKRLAMDDKLVEFNKMMLMQYQSKKEAKEDPIDWDEFFEEDDDDEAGPSGGGGGSELAGRWVAQVICECLIWMFMLNYVYDL